jgi:hypothetical protein
MLYEFPHWPRQTLHVDLDGIVAISFDDPAGLMRAGPAETLRRGVVVFNGHAETCHAEVETWRALIASWRGRPARVR